MRQLRIEDFKRLNAALRDWEKWGISSPTAPEVVKPIYGGLSNHNFLVKCGTHKLVARLNNPSADAAGIDRSLECRILNALKKIDVGNEFIYWHKAGNVALFNYIEGEPWTEKDLRNNFDLLSKTVTQYQSEMLNIPAFRYDQYLANLWLILSTKYPDISHNLSLEWRQFYSKLVSFSRKERPSVVCHHDLSAKHIIQSEHGIRIINWEYASVGHPAFDLTYVGIDSSDTDQDTAFVREIIRWTKTIWRYLIGT